MESKDQVLIDLNSVDQNLQAEKIEYVVELFNHFTEQNMSKISQKNLDLYKNYIKNHRKTDVDLFIKYQRFAEKYLKPQDVLNTAFIKVLVGTQISNYQTEISAKLTKNHEKCEKYSNIFSEQNSKNNLIFTISFPVQQDIKDSTKQFEEFQKNFKILKSSLSATNRKAKDFYKKFEMTFKQVKKNKNDITQEYFCMNIKLNQEYVEKIVGITDQIKKHFDGFTKEENFQLGLYFGDKLDSLVTEGQTTMGKAILSMLKNCKIQFHSFIVKIIEKIYQQIENEKKDSSYNEKIANIIQAVTIMKKGTAIIQLNELNENDVKSFLPVVEEIYETPIAKINLPFRINILVKMVELFSNTFESQCDILVCTNDINFKAKAKTIGFTNFFTSIIKY